MVKVRLKSETCPPTGDTNTSLSLEDKYESGSKADEEICIIMTPGDGAGAFFRSKREGKEHKQCERLSYAHEFLSLAYRFLKQSLEPIQMPPFKPQNQQPPSSLDPVAN